MDRFSFDVAHLLAGGLLLVSFLMLYQDRLYALLNTYAVHAVVLSASVAWQAAAWAYPSNGRFLVLGVLVVRAQRQTIRP